MIFKKAYFGKKKYIKLQSFALIQHAKGSNTCISSMCNKRNFNMVSVFENTCLTFLIQKKNKVPREKRTVFINKVDNLISEFSHLKRQHLEFLQPSFLAFLRAICI